MWFDDADIQIIGINYDELNLKQQFDLYKLTTEFNESMRYKNVIKRQDKEIKKLNVELLEEKLKNAKNNLESFED